MTLRDFSRGNEPSNRFCYKDMTGVAVYKIESFYSIIYSREPLTHLPQDILPRNTF